MTQLLTEADYYEVLNEEEQLLQCHLCPLECQLGPSTKGLCKGRMNIAGKLYSLIYGYSTFKIDMIEKQHVYHFFPNSRVQTFTTYNCNLDCGYCLDVDKAQIEPEKLSGKKYTPENIVAFGMASGSRVLCFGNAEPLLAFEFVRDTVKVAKSKNMRVLIRTNAYFNEEPIKEVIPYIDAFMIEIKAADDEGYENTCKRGSFEHVKKITKLLYDNEKHVELSFVVHPEIGNDLSSVGVIAKWIATELHPEVPLHLIRLAPTYRTSNLMPTKREDLEQAYHLALEMGLKHVYLDDIPSHEFNHTLCPKCGTELIKRSGTLTEVLRVSLQRQCNKCGHTQYVIMS